MTISSPGSDSNLQLDQKIENRNEMIIYIFCFKKDFRQLHNAPVPISEKETDKKAMRFT